MFNVTHLVYLRRPMIRNIDDINPGAAEGRYDEFVPDAGGVPMTRGARVPAHVV